MPLEERNTTLMGNSIGISLTTKGDWDTVLDPLEKMKNVVRENRIRKYGELGVRLLADATPKDTGKTAASWDFKVERFNDGDVRIIFTNSNRTPYYGQRLRVRQSDGKSTMTLGKDAPIVLLLQYGHGTGTGGYVQGRDFINPAMNELMEEVRKDIIVNNLWDRSLLL